VLQIVSPVELAAMLSENSKKYKRINIPSNSPVSFPGTDHAVSLADRDHQVVLAQSVVTPPSSPQGVRELLQLEQRVVSETVTV